MESFKEPDLEKLGTTVKLLKEADRLGHNQEILTQEVKTASIDFLDAYKTGGQEYKDSLLKKYMEYSVLLNATTTELEKVRGLLEKSIPIASQTLEYEVKEARDQLKGKPLVLESFIE